MTGGLLLFRVRGVPVLLAPSWWVGSLLVTLLYAPLVGRLIVGVNWAQSFLLALTFALLLAVSVLLHELGHCVVALRLGLPVRRVRLFLLGGVSEVSRAPRRPREEGLVALAGPLVSIVLSGLSGMGVLVVAGGGSPWLLLMECTVANLAVTVFNLLPGLPLDGGRILRAGVWAATGRRAIGTKLAVAGAGVIAAALIVWALAGVFAASEDRWLRLAVCAVTAWFVIGGAAEELAGERRSAWPDGLRLADLLRPVLQLPAESPVGDALSASAGRGVVLV
ncbi:MAG: site-2 protease family protein, partial [Sciscionella sp.]